METYECWGHPPQPCQSRACHHPHRSWMRLGVLHHLHKRLGLPRHPRRSWKCPDVLRCHHPHWHVAWLNEYISLNKDSVKKIIPSFVPKNEKKKRSKQWKNKRIKIILPLSSSSLSSVPLVLVPVSLDSDSVLLSLLWLETSCSSSLLWMPAAGISDRRWRVRWVSWVGGAGNGMGEAKRERGGGATLIPLSLRRRSDL